MNTNRSIAIAKTWTNKKVAQRRALKQRVVVGKYEYRSVRAAFEDLGLPLAKHIPFRQVLKADGVAKFGGKTFKLVEAA